LALSKLALKTNGMPRRSQVAFREAATRRQRDSLSITHGPAIKLRERLAVKAFHRLVARNNTARF
jgi:hypothetical protein